MATHPGFEAKWTSVAFRPYMLNPELEGLPPTSKIKHLEDKLGKPLAEMRSVQRLQERGKDFGLHYRYGADDLASGTLDSHRLLRYVDTDGGWEAAFTYRRALMKAFNEEGRALSDRGLLLEAAIASGVDQDVAEAVLEGPAYRTEVTWLDREARKEGIDMVPHYRFHTPSGLHSVVGYYEEWHFLDAMYRSFPEQPDQESWAEAGAQARCAAEAFTSLHEAIRALRDGGDEMRVQKAREAADEAERACRERAAPRHRLP